jgi:hypothetical protein
VHQTTIRFSEETWGSIEREARAIGVSAAQFVREAAIMRLVGTDQGRGAAEPGIEGDRLAAGNAGLGASRIAENSHAVWAQAQQARKRAREMREAARELQARSGRGGAHG